MVDSIGAKPLSGDRSITRIAAPAPIQQAVRNPAEAPTEEAAATQLSGIAKDLAKSAPVDLERVATIKKAIADGSFPILPSTIADRLLALRMDWNPNGDAQ